MAAVKFGQVDVTNIELVRQIVIRRLKDGHWNQLYDEWNPNQVGQFVVFEPDHLRNSFIVLMLEVMWQLIIQGVITPGINAPNPALPYFRITSYGQKVLEEERFVPHDPVGYLIEIKKVTKTAVGQGALPYIEEALRCFTSGCNTAATMMVGIAAEAVFLGLCSVVAAKLKNAADQQALDRLQWVKPKHRWILDKFQALPQAERKKLPESLDVTLTSLYELIRKQRNEIGHPSDKPPDISRDLAFVYLRMFPTYVSDAEAFASYCDANGL